MRKFIFAIALLLGVFFLFSRFTEVQSVVTTFQQGQVGFIYAGIVVLALWYFVCAGSYRAIYQSLGVDEKISRLVHLTLAAYFVNVVAPVAGMSGMAVFVSDARQRNHSVARVTVATALFVLFDYAGFLVVLTLGLAVLARRNRLDWPELSASIILVVIALFLTFLLYLGARSGESLGKALASLARIVNKVARPFIHREYLSLDRAHTFANEAAEGLSEMRKRPRSWIKPLFFALINKVLLLTIFMLCFLSFKVPFSAGTIIAGFSIGYLFLIVSPTPSGIGVVEGVLTLTLTSLRVPLEASAVIVLAFRGITFWLPLLVGLVAFRTLPREDRTVPPVEIT